jgi:hypothetical protein
MMPCLGLEVLCLQRKGHRGNRLWFSLKSESLHGFSTCLADLGVSRGKPRPPPRGICTSHGQKYYAILQKRDGCGGGFFLSRETTVGFAAKTVFRPFKDSAIGKSPKDETKNSKFSQKSVVQARASTAFTFSAFK